MYERITLLPESHNGCPQCGATDGAFHEDWCLSLKEEYASFIWNDPVVEMERHKRFIERMRAEKRIYDAIERNR